MRRKHDVLIEKRRTYQSKAEHAHKSTKTDGYGSKSTFLLSRTMLVYHKQPTNAPHQFHHAKKNDQTRR